MAVALGLLSPVPAAPLRALPLHSPQLAHPEDLHPSPPLPSAQCSTAHGGAETGSQPAPQVPTGGQRGWAGLGWT